MKKLLFIVPLFFLCLSLKAQQDFTFRNVVITGKIVVAGGKASYKTFIGRVTGDSLVMVPFKYLDSLVNAIPVDSIKIKHTGPGTYNAFNIFWTNARDTLFGKQLVIDYGLLGSTTADSSNHIKVDTATLHSWINSLGLSGGSYIVSNNLRLSGNNISDKDTIVTKKTFNISPVVNAMAIGTGTYKILVHPSDSTVAQVPISTILGNPAADPVIVPTRSANDNSTNAANTIYVDNTASLITTNITAVSFAGSVLNRAALNVVTLDPASVAGTGNNITTPASPKDGDRIIVIAGGQIAAGSPVNNGFTIVANTGQSIYGITFPIVLNGADSFCLYYDLLNTKWKRIKL